MLKKRLFLKTEDIIRQVPKVLLHDHLDGGLRVETIIDLAKEWHNRPLETVYPIVFFDAIHYKVREDGKVVSKAAYTCLGITNEGKKEILGINYSIMLSCH